jgi:hypothetical protein
MFVETLGTVHRRRVGVHVHKEKNAERNDAGKLVQLSEQERVTEFDRHQLGLSVRMSEILEPKALMSNIRRSAFHDTGKIL